MENEENTLRSKLSQLANSVSDKMSILDARDKLMRLKRHKQTNLATAVAVVGTCPDMCPEYERYFREETNQVTSLEMDSNGRPDENKMIKEYRRSGADQEEPLPHELRPTHILIRTMDYLCTNIMDNQSVSVGEWYDFVWSRTRSIRKDMTQQHLCDLSSVALTEKCARFHIYCAAKLCEENIKDFDPKINEENLSNCLQSLKDFYYDLSLRDISCENEAEFRSYDILLHLNDAGILRDVKNYRKEIRDSSQVRFAIQAFYSYQSNNYINFFKLAEKSHYLMSCIMHRYFTHVRQQAFKILRKSYTSNSSSVQEYPIHLLVHHLGFENDADLIQFCDRIGLECSDRIVYLVRGLNDSNAIKAQRSFRLVENKLKSSVGEVINGNPLPINPYKSVPVHDSFDSDGRLKTDAYEALDQQIKTNSLNNSSKSTIISENVNTKPIFDSEMMPKPRFGTASSANTLSVLATTSKPLFGSFPIQESKSSTFSFAKPSTSFQLPQTSLWQLTKPDPQFNSSVSCDGIRPIQSPKQAQTNQLSMPQTPLDSDKDINEETIERLYDNVLGDLIDSVCKELLVDICGQELEKVRNSAINEMVCKIFSNILFSLTDSMIKEVAVDVIQEETDLKNKEKEKIKYQKILMENISIEISDQMISSFVDSQIRSISEQVYNESYEELVEKENELLANDLFNELVVKVVKGIAAEVFAAATKERELLVECLNQKRLKRLEKKYFDKWKNWYLRKKRHQYYKESFPAAPNWNSRNAITSQIKYTYSQEDCNNSYEKLIENELLANDLLNDSIDIIVKDIAAEAFLIVINRIESLVESVKQKRLKHLEQKYFYKWTNWYLERKRNKNHKKSFPAAPNWNSSDSISSRVKYSYPGIDPDIEMISVKRARRETNEQNKTDQSTPPSSDYLKLLLNEEICESEALTKRLNEALEPMSGQVLYSSLIGSKSNIDTNIKMITVDADEEDNEISINLFETSTDKMNRLKRMLDEEKNYNSLNSFVSYLTNNDNVVQQIEDSSYQLFQHS